MATPLAQPPQLQHESFHRPEQAVAGTPPLPSLLAGVLAGGRKKLLRLRHLPDRVLHPLRRRRALARLRREGLPASVVFVCNGNIYRSPFAAHAFSRALSHPLHRAVQIDSAGLLGPGRPAPQAAREVAVRHGVTLDAHRSRLLTESDLAAGGLVVVMEPVQLRVIHQRFGAPAARSLVLGDLDPLPPSRRAIQDPWRGTGDDVVAAYDRIQRCIRILAQAIRGER
jgi:protein-tyrosine phosphatase